MSFETELLAAIGAKADVNDIRASVRRCYFYDFVDDPLRLWDGQGVLIAGGNEWIGTVTPEGFNLHETSPLRDPRDGASLRYEFKLPYLDEQTWLALKADKSKAEGRELTVYYVIVKHGEGLVPGTALQFVQRMKVQAIKFGENIKESGGTMMRTRSAGVVCRSLEAGRSRVPNGTLTDASQVERARVLGVSSDSGCSFVAANSRRTFRFD